MSHYKYIFLIIDSDTNHLYDHNRNIIRKYMNIIPDIKSFFIMMDNDISNILIDGDTIKVLGVESLYPGIIIKTLKSMEFCLNNFSFDYIIRTNISSFWNLYSLINLYDTLPRQKLIQAIIGHHGCVFPSGSGMIISRDIISLMVSNKEEFNMTINDDVSVGQFLQKYNITITAGLRYDYTSNNENISPSDIDKMLHDNHYHYRIKDNSDRQHDKNIFDMLYNSIYNKFKISYALTAVNDNPKYTRFIPLYIKVWKKLYPDIKPVILYIGHENEELDEYKNYIIYIDPIEGLDTAFVAQTIRILYPSLLDNTGAVVISDMDILPGDGKYFSHHISSYNKNTFISYRPKHVVAHNQIAICYNAAYPEVWRDIFNIHNLDDIVKFLQKNYRNHYDGIHGGKGWYSDQEILYQYVTEWQKKGNNLIYLGDNTTNFKRLDYFHHCYNMTNFMKLYKQYNSSDCHLYASECPWTADDIKSFISEI